MKELKQIIATYRSYQTGGRKAALATVVKVEGSAYRRPGARMLIMADGRWQGSISGGCLEGDALKKARQLMKGQQAELITYDTTEKGAHDLYLGLGCHGRIEILLEPLQEDTAANSLLMLEGFLNDRKEGVMATVTQSSQWPLGTRLLWDQEQALPPQWALYNEGFKAALSGGRSLNYLFEQEGGTKTEVFFEYLNPGIELYVFGAGFDVVPITEFASILGWKVVVFDNCVAHLAPLRIPKADAMHYTDFCQLPAGIKPGRFSAALVMSHNYKFDAQALKFLLDKPIPYVGLMGPRLRFERMAAEFPELAGYSTAERLFNPIGLDIGAENPEEIALSIVSEIKAFFAGRAGQMLRQRNTTIYARQQLVSVNLASLA